MKKNPLKSLSIRAAALRLADLGDIYASDLKKEEKGEPHAITFLWDNGKFYRGDCNYDAHSICYIDKPTHGLVDISEPGYYSVITKDDILSGDIIEDSNPPSKQRRIRGFRSVAEIANQAYAVGLMGMVYRLDELNLWQRIDDGLPQSFDIEAIHGFNDSEIYAVGGDGQLWSYNGKIWKEIVLPTNADLNTIICVDNKEVYIAGMGGILIHGRQDIWEIIDQEDTGDDIWDLEWFNEKLYVATMNAVYYLKKDGLQAVDFGDDSPRSCNQLSSAKDVLWSIGEYDIMSLNDKRWTRIV